MNDAIRRHWRYWVLASGVFAASTHWLWAKGFITLWIFLGALSFGSSRPFVIHLRNLWMFIAVSASIGGIGTALAGSLHAVFIFLIWAGLIAYAVFLYRSNGDVWKKEDSIWPSPFWIVCFVLIVGGSVLLAFPLLSFLVGQPFKASWISSLTWAALGVILAHPHSIERDASSAEKRLLRWMPPVLIVITLFVHFVQHRSIAARLEAAKQSGISCAEAADAAARRGFYGLAMQGVLSETGRLHRESGWIEAVDYHRGMWRFLDKDRLAAAYLNVSSLKNNLFLFTICYGSSLALPPDEQAVDVAVLPDLQAVRVLTSQGRILELGADGLRRLYQGLENPIGFHMPSKGLPIAVLHPHSIQILHDFNEVKSIQTAVDRVWTDLYIDSTGTQIHTLDGNGRIEKYVYDLDNQFWSRAAEVHPALWSESDIARAFYPGEFDGSFYVLDCAEGIHWRGTPPLPPGSPLDKQLNHYYNPNRRLAVRLDYWAPLSSLIILEQTGRMLLAPKPDFSAAAASMDQLASATSEIPMPIESLLEYDPNQSAWHRRLESTSMAVLPECNTILKLQRNGVLQAIAMPQRFHIRFVHPEDYRMPAEASSLSQDSGQ
ncbi:MAG: hypothetical protein JXR73_01695 [Candidatus Omnitrophica bacterium]|nr:hypothetical protein [Candidatus Omnitrophota bacterium]